MRTISSLTAAASALIATPQSTYTFTHDTVQFLTIGLQGGVELVMDLNDEHVFHELDGETFFFFGEQFTFDATHTIAAGAHGDIRVRNDTAEVLIDALHAPLAFADPASAVLARITGTPGDKLLEVEWRDWGLMNGPPNNIGSFAIAVHQASGEIELRYGTSNINGQMLFDDDTGPLAGLAFVNGDITFCHRKMWVEGDAHAPTLDSLPDLDMDGLHNVPRTDAVYRFTPRALVNGVAEPESRPLVLFTDLGDRIRIHQDGANAGGQLGLFDNMGRALQAWHITASDATVPILEPASGIYILRFTSMSGKMASWKFARP